LPQLEAVCPSTMPQTGKEVRIDAHGETSFFLNIAIIKLSM
jgi:hypothetical protein